MYDLFYIGKKDNQFKKLKARFFTLKTAESFEHAQKKATTKFFWCIWSDLLILDNFSFDYIPDENSQDIPHVFRNTTDWYGIWLYPKKLTSSQKEIEYRFLVSVKQVEIDASSYRVYEKYFIETYDDYLYAIENSESELFYAIPRQVDITNMPSLYFSHDDEYNRKENHTFKNICNGEEKDNGVFLCSKHKPISKREIEYRHIVHKKLWNIIVSKHKPYDVVFISYNELNADNNYKNLLKKAPYAKRVHGIKGIHQAHIEAAKKCNSDMLWIVDADAVLIDDFNLDLYIEKWDRETVHVWRSKNPINNLVYGYGGIKLFPRLLTINMDISKPDMTTSITSKFKAMQQVSNVTAFNTDPFNTWKSAFRECCKLSSKIIDRQKAKETEERLNIWCTIGKDKLFGEYAVTGAKAGKEYGENNRGDLEALRKINDFDWLKEQFEKY